MYKSAEILTGGLTMKRGAQSTQRTLFDLPGATPKRSRLNLENSRSNQSNQSNGSTTNADDHGSAIQSNLLISKGVTNMEDIIKELLHLQHGFPEVYHLIKVVAMTIPVTSATAERSFSVLKRIKTYLRATMGQERLTHLAVLSIERELSRNIDLDSVIDHFSCNASTSYATIILCCLISFVSFVVEFSDIMQLIYYVLALLIVVLLLIAMCVLLYISLLRCTW